MRLPLSILAILAAAPAAAQLVPAEAPPPDFAGAEYVDSTGCAFQRVTLGGETRFVPRLDATRAPVCGLTPTGATAVVDTAGEEAADDALVGDAVAAEAEADVEAAPEVVADAPAAPAAPEAVDAAPETAAVAEVEPVLPAEPAAAPPRVLEDLGPVAVAPVSAPAAPRRAVPAARAVSASRPVAARPRVSPALYARRAAAAAALTGGQTGRVVDGEQIAVPVAVPGHAIRVPAGQPSPRRALSVRDAQRVAPLAACGEGVHGAPRSLHCPATSGWFINGSGEERDGVRYIVVPQASTTFHYGGVPHGFESVWKDGRLNPLRGPQTLQGDYQSEAVWTNETPRRLRRIIRVAPAPAGH